MMMNDFFLMCVLIIPKALCDCCTDSEELTDKYARHYRVLFWECWGDVRYEFLAAIILFLSILESGTMIHV